MDVAIEGKGVGDTDCAESYYKLTVCEQFEDGYILEIGEY